MGDDDTDRARRDGEERGRMLATQANLEKRVARLENAILGLMAALGVAWAKLKGLL